MAFVVQTEHTQAQHTHTHTEYTQHTHSPTHTPQTDTAAAVASLK